MRLQDLTPFFDTPTVNTRAFVILLLFFSMALLSRAEAKSGSDYTIINTGIKGGVCWYDDTHFIVMKSQQSAPGQTFELEGLYYLDPSQPRDLKPISLTPLDPTMQKKVWSVSCQEGSIVFLVPGAKKGSSRLYRLRIGEEPELMVEMRAPRVSLSGQYVLGNSHKAVMGGGPLQGVFEGNDDCLLSYAKPGFKPLCWDWWLVMPQALPQFVLSEYRWEGSIKIKDSNEQVKRVPNPEPPLKRPDGTELKHGYLLRDLEGRIVQEIPTKQDMYQIYAITFEADPTGRYLYATCAKAGDHGNRFITFGGRICRFLLDGKNQQWEEVASVQQSPANPFSLHDLNVNARGDVVVIERGHRGVTSLWKYSAGTGAVEQITKVPGMHTFGGPRISPDGKWVSFLDQSLLFLASMKGVTP